VCLVLVFLPAPLLKIKKAGASPNIRVFLKCISNFTTPLFGVYSVGTAAAISDAKIKRTAIGSLPDVLKCSSRPAAQISFYHIYASNKS
jgi:hypothetical protein